MKIRLLGDLGAHRVDHYEATATPLGYPNIPHQMQVRDGGVVAPDHVELSIRSRLGADPRNQAVGAYPSLVADQAAQ